VLYEAVNPDMMHFFFQFHPEKTPAGRKKLEAVVKECQEHQEYRKDIAA